MPKQVFLLLGLVAIVNASCGQDSRVPDLERKTQDLTTKVESLQKDIESLKSAKSFEELVANFGKVAYLTPGQERVRVRVHAREFADPPRPYKFLSPCSSVDTLT